MTLNAATLSAGASLSVLQEGWAAQLDGTLTASWMLHGRPGVGKSQIVQQLSDLIGARLFDLRLTTIEPQDLRGLPYYDHDARQTIWYRPEDLPDDPSIPSVLFLDELTAASPYLQPTVYGLLQERRVGKHRLPDNVMVIGAGNMVEDGAIAYEMGTALSDRLIHLHVQADVTDWLENYAAPKGLAPEVAAFLRAHPHLLDTTEESLRRGDMIVCTPRAWERTSDILRAVRNRQARRAMIAGTLGEKVAADFFVMAEEIAVSVDVEGLLQASPAARYPLFPDTLHGLNALMFALVGAANDKTMPAVIEVMNALRFLAEKRDAAVFERLPLDELSRFGFELLMRKALDAGMQDVFAQSDAYASYVAHQQALGLD